MASGIFLLCMALPTSFYGVITVVVCLYKVSNIIVASLCLPSSYYGETRLNFQAKPVVTFPSSLASSLILMSLCLPFVRGYHVFILC